MIDENKIREQYQEHKTDFDKTKGNLHETLENIAGTFYQRTRFRAKVLEPRLKTADSIIGKMRRKNIDSDSLFTQEGDELSLVVNDFLGARIVCNTHEDVEEMADLLTGLDPAVYVLDRLWNMSVEMVSERVEPFVKRLREAHPDTPILLVEDSNVRNLTPTAKGCILRDIYEKLTAEEGIANLYFLANQGMLGGDGEGTVDGCHPNDLGMMRQAAVFTESLVRILQISEP